MYLAKGRGKGKIQMAKWHMDMYGLMCVACHINTNYIIFISILLMNFKW